MSDRYFAHGGIVCLVLVEFLLDSVGELDHLLILARRRQERAVDGER